MRTYTLGKLGYLDFRYLAMRKCMVASDACAGVPGAMRICGAQHGGAAMTGGQGGERKVDTTTQPPPGSSWAVVAPADAHVLQNQRPSTMGAG